jgi:hypothetical protein
MSTTAIPSLAVVIEGGLVQSVIVQDWPKSVPRPRVAIVDYDTDGANEDDLLRFTIGSTPAQALCHSEMVEVYESFREALSPRDLLDALDDSQNRATVGFCTVCGAEIRSVLGCPDGSEICPACFDSGAH